MNKAKENPQITEEKISLREKFAYGLGDLASNLVFSSLNSFITFFYTNVVGIAAGAVGTVIFISKIFDGVVDVGYGILVDRTKSKYGKARPWLLWLAVPFALCLIAVFTVPNFSDTGKIIYAFVTYTLMMAGAYSAINIPYGVLTALITSDQYQRSVLNIFRMANAMIGGLVVSVATMPVVNALGGDARAWQITFAAYGILAAVLFLLCFFGIKERTISAVPETDIVSKNGPSVRDAVKSLFKNKYWVMMMVLGTLLFFTQGAQGAMIYFFDYSLNRSDLFAQGMTASLVPAVVSIILISPFLLKKLGKRNTVLIGALIQFAGCLLMSVCIKNPVAIFIGIILKGAGNGLAASCAYAMIADTIEYGEYKTGIRCAGLVFSGASLINTVGSGLGAAMVGWLLALGRYDPALAVQSPSAVYSINFLYVYLPLIIAGVSSIALLFYNLDKEYPRVIAELRKRNSG